MTAILSEIAKKGAKESRIVAFYRELRRDPFDITCRACGLNKKRRWKKRGSILTHPHASKRSPRHCGERRKGIYHILCIRLTRARSSARCTARRESRITDLSCETNFCRVRLSRANFRVLPRSVLSCF